MNCPYCDETIHSQAKYCPKCGLPVKEDATLMGGAYLSDDGPNWPLIGGGAGALLVIALLIGWAGSRGNQAPPPTVTREAVTPFTAGASGRFGGYSGYAGGFNSGIGGSQGSPSMVNEPGRWAWTPPATPPRRPVAPPPAPEPPRHQLTMLPRFADGPRQAPRVEQRPEISVQLPSAPPPQPVAQVEVAPGPAPRSPEAALNDEIVTREAGGTWVWDPVQERWALRVDRPNRSNSGPAQRPALRAGTPAAARPGPVADAPATGTASRAEASRAPMDTPATRRLEPTLEEPLSASDAVRSGAGQPVLRPAQR